MVDMNQIPSILKLQSIWFEKISYQRLSSENDDCTSKVGINVIGPEVDHDNFVVAIQVHLTGEGKYILDVVLKGQFSISGGLNESNSYLLTNAVAIMFPYLRSEVSLLTTQPGIAPVVLPPINVQQLMAQRRKQNTEHTQ